MFGKEAADPVRPGSCSGKRAFAGTHQDEGAAPGYADGGAVGPPLPKTAPIALPMPRTLGVGAATGPTAGQVGPTRSQVGAGKPGPSAAQVGPAFDEE